MALTAAISLKSALSGARCADVTGFGVREHHADGSALHVRPQGEPRNLAIGWMSAIS